MKLSEQKCVPCEGKADVLPPDVVQNHLKELNGWVLQGKSIGKQYTLQNFKTAMSFVNKIADVAEMEGHHPDIFISYNIVRIELWTHAIGGLSQNDFVMAAKIDELTQ